MAHNNNIAFGDWFDILLPRVRNLTNYLSDEEIYARLDNEPPEHVFLCLAAAKILDKPVDIG